jgi:hypothetical protein
MNRKAVTVLAIVLIAAASAGAQITLGASYLADVNPARSSIVRSAGAFTSFVAVGADMSVCALHGGLEVFFAGGTDLGFDGTIDFNFIRYSPPKSGFGLTLGGGIEPWMEFISNKVNFSVLLHLPFDVSWQPLSQLPIQVYLKLSPFLGISLVTGTPMIYGLDANLGVRWVIVSN